MSTGWEPLINKNLGLTATLGRVMVSAAISLPDMPGPCLVVTSDYSGSHKASCYECYSVLIADLSLCGDWRRMRTDIRCRFLRDNRRMSYKNLNDQQRRRALRPFLVAANEIPGLCISLAVAKNIDTLFIQDNSPINRELAEVLSWKKGLFERALRIVHLVSFFIAGLSHPGQDVLWFSDEDEIAANASRLTLLTKVWANVLSNYVDHTLRHLRCGTTHCDDGTNEIEDLTALPDLTAGAVADLLGPIAGQIRNGIIVPSRLNAKPKAMVIGQWLSDNAGRLKKIVLAVDKKPQSADLTVSRIGFEDLTGLQAVHLAVSRI